MDTQIMIRQMAIHALAPPVCTGMYPRLIIRFHDMAPRAKIRGRRLCQQLWGAEEKKKHYRSNENGKKYDDLG
jgi:hypothetical protein